MDSSAHGQDLIAYNSNPPFYKFTLGQQVIFTHDGQSQYGIIRNLKANRVVIEPESGSKNLVLSYQKIKPVDRVPFEYQPVFHNDIEIHNAYINNYTYTNPIFPDEIRPTFSYPVIGQYSSNFIDFYRQRIYKSLHYKYYQYNKPGYKLPATILNDMWNLYNKYFFNGHLSKIIDIMDFKLVLSFTSEPSLKITKEGNTFNIMFSEDITICDDKIICCSSEMEYAILQFIIEANPHYEENSHINSMWIVQLGIAFFGITDIEILSLPELHDFTIGQLVKFPYSETDIAYGIIEAIDDDNINVVINGTNITYYRVLPVTKSEELRYYQNHRDSGQLYIVSFDADQRITVDNTSSSVLYNIPNISFPVQNRYPSKFIETNRRKIYNIIKRKYGDNLINQEILHDLYILYDKLFFKRYISDSLAEINVDITLEYGETALHILAVTELYGKHINIIFNKSLTTDSKSYNTVGNIPCREGLHCLQMIVEHELIHVLIHGLQGISNSSDVTYGVHGKLFKQLLFAYFGQTSHFGHFDDIVKHQIEVNDYITLNNDNVTNIYKVLQITDDLFHLDNGIVVNSKFCSLASPVMLKRYRELIYYQHDARINLDIVHAEALPKFEYPMTMRYSREYIDYYTNLIYSHIIDKYKLDRKIYWFDIKDEIVLSILKLYDIYFFKGYIFENERNLLFTLNIQFSKINAVLATCEIKQCHYTLTISIPQLYHMATEINKDPTVQHNFDGLQCNNLIKCLMLVLTDILLDLIIHINMFYDIDRQISRNLEDYKRQLQLAFFNRQ